MSINTTVQILEDMKNGVPVEKYLNELHPLIYNTDKYIEICSELTKNEDYATKKIWTELRGNIVCPDIRIGYLEKAIEFLPYDKLRSIKYQLDAINDQILIFKPYFNDLVLGTPNYSHPLETSEAILLAKDEAHLLWRQKTLMPPTPTTKNTQKDKYFNGMQQLKDYQLREYFLEIIKFPAFVKELSEYELSKVRNYADKALMDSVRQCAGFLEIKNYKYPPEFEENRKIEYWFSKSADYQDATYVINLIDNHLAKLTQPANPQKGGLKFYIGDPENGGKEVNSWEYWNESGMKDRLEQKGLKLNPTHDFNLLKPFRLNLFNQIKEYFIKERAFNGLETTETEIKARYLIWLNEELKTIENWLSDKSPNGEPKRKPSISTQIEIGKYFDFIKNEIETVSSGNQPAQTPNTETITPEIKPVFKTEITDQVYNILKDYFNTNQQPQLKQLIETGSDTSPKLLFKGNANQLTDTWQKLYDCQFIIGCQKEVLQQWTIKNFCYSGKKKDAIDFEYETVRKGISNYTNPCMNPLLKIENGQIVAVKQEQKKKYRKY
ncbi:hypothetical protein [Adhaeribacter terreus]|uniref:Uncharacterized protein n=1 Tax=Adhaeribacter terreus TaxID=529703 RepID=A0ABW0EB89_9BACT